MNFALPPTPMQFGVPGGLELVIILFIVLIPVAIGYAMYKYADSHDDENAALWGVVAAVASLVATPIGALLVFVVYVWQRD